MTWLGNWLGGGGAAAPAPRPAAPASRPAGSIFAKVWRVLAAAFHGSTTEIFDSIALALEAGKKQSLVIQKLAATTHPATQQEIRISIRLMAQATKSSHTEKIISDALAALETAETISIVSRETSAEDFDEVAATDGLFRQIETIEVRG